MDPPVLQTEPQFSLCKIFVKVIGWMQKPNKYFDLRALTKLCIVSKELSYVATHIINNCTRFDVSNEKIKFHLLKIPLLAKQLFRMKNLTHLSISNIHIGQIGALALVEHDALSKNLTYLDISNTHIDSGNLIILIPSIANMTKLKHLNIATRSYSHTSDVTMALTPHLALMTELTQLNLGGHKISPTCATTLVASLLHIDRLTDINLCRCGLDDSVLAPSFSRMTNLTCLNLSENSINALTPWFEHITKLTNLDISFNFISDTGVLAFGQSLVLMTNLTYLNLSYSLVHFTYYNNRESGTQSLIALAQYLPYISKLTHFNLSGNNIGVQGAIALASCLPYMSELTTLDLLRNKIHAHGALKIVRNYTHMTKLAHLDLSYNNIGGQGVKALVPCLAHMTNLRYINLHPNNIRKGVIPILKTIFAQMTNLKVDII